MKPTILIFAVCVIAVARPGWSQAASENNGKVVFDKWCAPCHGAVAPKEGMFGGGALPGTAALTVKYKGRLPAVLEERTDLRPNVIASVVRGGLFGMPITRKTEVSDAELQDIVAYLTRNRKP
jgi:mono/diheme cytochrome c family protein